MLLSRNYLRVMSLCGGNRYGTIQREIKREMYQIIWAVIITTYLSAIGIHLIELLSAIFSCSTSYKHRLWYEMCSPILNSKASLDELKVVALTTSIICYIILNIPNDLGYSQMLIVARKISPKNVRTEKMKSVPFIVIVCSWISDHIWSII